MIGKWRSADARSRFEARRDVQLRLAGEPDPDEPPAAPDPGGRCRSTHADGPQAGESALAKWPAIDCAGAPDSRTAAASALYVRSERLLVEQLEYKLLFRWFVGLSVDEPVWDHSSFSKNRDRLFGADIARDLFDSIIAQAHATGLLSDEHFSVDGT
ncbi:MAG TPA: transposase [Steroidobacteraceae bacterium]|nr:transposase [Steroidobacteraceae bacterium]